MFGAVHSADVPSVPDVLLRLARAFTPRVEARGPGTVLLDLRGMNRAWPDASALGQALVGAGRAQGLEPQVALAGTRTAAWLLARARPGPTVVPAGQEAASLAPLPLATLELPAEQADLLHRWGLRTLGELAALPAESLFARLGPEGPRLRSRALGRDEEPMVAAPLPETFVSSLELEWPVDGLEPLSFLLARVLEPLCARLLARGRRASAITLLLRLVDGGAHERRLRPAAPSADARTWRTLLLLDLEAHAPRDAVAAFTVTVEPTPARRVQFSLLDPAQPSPERLAETLARLQEWTAEGRAGSPVLLDTHRPGAFAMGPFDPSPTPIVHRPPTLSLPTSGEGYAVASMAPELPVTSSIPRLCLRAFRPALPAQVLLEAGLPAFVSASGICGRVADRAGPWRASGDWWDVAWSREEWDVTVGGGLFRIYRDRLRGGWFVEGELD